MNQVWDGLRKRAEGGSSVPTTVHLTLEEASHELYSVVPEVNVPHLIFTFLSVFILVFGMFSALIKERLYAGEAIVAVAFGICFGPYAAGLVEPRLWGSPSFDDVTLEVTRIVLALSVFAVGVELPRAYVKRHWRSLIMVLGPLMVVGWLITAGLIYGLVPGLSFLGALVVAACATPTDPILAASVVGKGKFAQKHVPSHIRHLLQCESGCNDGAAFPFLYLALFLLFREEHNVGEAIGWWILLVLLYQIVLGTSIGIFIGIAARKTLKFSKRRSLIDRESMVAMYISLAIFTTAVTTLAGSDDLLAAFACGAAFAWDDWFSESIEDSNFSNIIDLLINCTVFIYIGATMPFSDFNNTAITLHAWRLVLLGLGIIVLRRLPIMLLLYKWIPDIKTFREAVFAGHFGPMGVGAIFIATLALHRLPTPNVPPENSNDILALTIQPITYFIVLCSVIVHGSSIPFFNLGKRVHSIHRTWTQGSNNEPSWLGRVKRLGDDNNGNHGDTDDAADRASPDESEKNEKRKKRPEVDLEAGEAVMDDAGMDIGDMSSRDFAGNGKSSRRNDQGEEISPTSSSSDATRLGSQDSKQGVESSKDDVVGNEDKAFKQQDPRRERHDSDDSDDEEVWQEGGETVIERHHGEDTEVVEDAEDDEDDPRIAERFHHKSSGRHEYSPKAEEHDHAQRGQQGPGFPGQRFAEIQHLLERGHDLAHKSHDKGSEENLQAKKEGKKTKEDDRPDDQLLVSASKQVADREDSADRSGVSSRDERERHAEMEDDFAKRNDKGKEAPPATKRSESASPAREAAPAQKTGMGMGMSMGMGLTRPFKPLRRSTLTTEEKYARDAWCRKERKDIDDDEVKAWVNGKHLVIERNNGEDVEIIDANPSDAARQKARNDPDLNIRALPIGQVNRAKSDIARSDSQAQAGEASGSAPPKRFDLTKMAGKESFRKLLFMRDNKEEGNSRGGQQDIAEGDEEEEENADSPQSVTFAEPPSASDASGSASTPGDAERLRRRNNKNANDGSGSETPNYLSTRKSGNTGIPLMKTDTTDSTIRFADLPKVRR